MKRYALTLDLINDPKLIDGYEEHHRNVWPEIIKSIKDAGILSMEIYRVDTRLFMIIEVDNEFSFERKSRLDSGDPKVLQWEELMWNYQKALPFAAPGEKWVVMNRIFSLS